MRAPIFLSGLILAAAVSAHAAPAAAANEPLPAAQAAELLGCAIPLAAARENLEARGYKIEPGASAVGFATQYLLSEKDSERRLLGSLAVERLRRYRVDAADGGIRFAPQHRETVFASGVLGHRDDRVREYDVAPTEAMLDTLRDMRREVCAGGAAAPIEARPNPEIEQYILDRCKSGDDRACKLLRLR